MKPSTHILLCVIIGFIGFLWLNITGLLPILQGWYHDPEHTDAFLTILVLLFREGVCLFLTMLLFGLASIVLTPFKAKSRIGKAA